MCFVYFVKLITFVKYSFEIKWYLYSKFSIVSKLGTTICSALFARFSQLSVFSLQFFKVFFLILSCIVVQVTQKLPVFPLSRVRWQWLCFEQIRFEVFRELIIITKVPVADPVKIYISHVITFDRADFLPIFFNFTLNEVLLFECKGIKLDVRLYTIRFIFKRLFTHSLPRECSDENIPEFIVS